MTHAELVERVADAILDAANDVSSGPDDFCSWSMAQAAARAAISECYRALMEPTQEMIAATAPAHEGEAIIAKVMIRAAISASLLNRERLMNDFIKRLLAPVSDPHYQFVFPAGSESIEDFRNACHEAAAEITRLKARVSEAEILVSEIMEYGTSVARFELDTVEKIERFLRGVANHE